MRHQAWKGADAQQLQGAGERAEPEVGDRLPKRRQAAASGSAPSRRAAAPGCISRTSGGGRQSLCQGCCGFVEDLRCRARRDRPQARRVIRALHQAWKGADAKQLHGAAEPVAPVAPRRRRRTCRPLFRLRLPNPLSSHRAAAAKPAPAAARQPVRQDGGEPRQDIRRLYDGGDCPPAGPSPMPATKHAKAPMPRTSKATRPYRRSVSDQVTDPKESGPTQRG